ncbi:hypothetical protein QCA50_008119 [Cerrena zonata]|uniref:Uncharacterized protein n=1 Tax=Cerrena zonata TaxID=2478898 RepID=A0AAW0G5E4_9APHY
MAFLFACSLIAWIACSFARSSIPDQWTNTSSTLSRIERVQLAQLILDSLYSGYNNTDGQLDDINFGQNANLISSIALHDLISKADTNRNVTIDHFARTLPSLIPAPQSVCDLHNETV